MSCFYLAVTIVLKCITLIDICGTGFCITSNRVGCFFLESHLNRRFSYGRNRFFWQKLKSITF